MRAVFILFCFLSIFQILPTHADTGRGESCERLLVQHARENESSFVPWAQLPKYLAKRESATLLVRIPLQTTTVRLMSLRGLGAEINGLRVPQEFLILDNGSLLAVVEGGREALLNASEEFGRRFGPELGFHILGSTVATKKFSLPLPTRLIEIPASDRAVQVLDEEVRGSNETRFGFYDVKLGQMVFVYPKRGELEGITTALLEKLGIASLVGEDSQPLLDWIGGHEQEMRGKTIVRFGGFFVVTQEAFNALKRLEGTDLKLARATTLKMTEELKRELHLCLSEVCVVTPRAAAEAQKAEYPEIESPTLAPEEDAWMREVRNGMLKRMMEKVTAAGKRSLYSSDGLRTAMLGIGDRLLPLEERASWQKEIAQIEFGIWDGRSLTEFLANGKGKYMILARFALGWKAMAARFVPELKEQPITPQNVNRLIEKIDEMLENGIPEQIERAQRQRDYSTQRVEKPLNNQEVFIIYDFLREEVKGVSLYQPGSMDSVFWELIQKVIRPDQIQEMKSAIAAIGFKEYDAANGRAATGGAAQRRIISAWNLFARAVDPALGEGNPTAADIKKAIAAYRARELAAPTASVAETKVAEALAVNPAEPAVLPAAAPAKVEEAKSDVAPAYELPLLPPITPAAPGPVPLVAHLKDEAPLTVQAKDAILVFLREYIRIGKMTDAGGVRRAFIDTLAPVWKGASEAIYKQALEDIHFSRFEYNVLKSSSSQMADARLKKGWRLLQEIVQAPGREETLTVSNVQATIEVYRRLRGVNIPVRTREAKPEPAPAKAAEPAARLSMSKDARNTLLKAGLRTGEIEEMLANWHGFTVDEGLPGIGGSVEWTLLIRSAETLRPNGYSRDDAYVAVVAHGEVVKVLPDDEKTESKFYRILAQKGGVERRTRAMHLLSKVGHDYIGTVEVDPGVSVKILLKHRYDVDQVLKALDTLKVTREKINGRIVLNVEGEVDGSMGRYVLVLAANGAPGTYKLVSFFTDGLIE